jgi:DNA-directed RNA polymerase specialized sigma24 family protein
MTYAIHPYYQQSDADADDDSALPTSLVWSTVTSGPARQFIDEWARLSRRPAVLRTVNSWSFLPRPVTDLDDLLTVCGFGTPFDDSEGDRVLWHITRLAAHDDLAARVCLHRIMPAVLSVARRRGRITQGGVHNAIGDAISTAWIVIREFPCDRRQTKIAANLVRDVEYYGFVRNQRLRRVPEIKIDTEEFDEIIDEPSNRTVDVELDDVLSLASELGVNERHIDLLQRLGTGRHGDDIAHDRGVSPRTIRNHRHNAVESVQNALIKNGLAKKL